MKDIKIKKDDVITANEVVHHDDHMIHLKHQVDKDFDENYKYVVKNKLHKFCMSLIWIIARPGIPIVTFFKHGLKVICSKEIKTFIKQRKSYISVSNHNLILDCAIAVKINRYRKTYIPTVTDTMKIPFARHIVRALNVVPIPTNLKGLVQFKKDINYALQDGKIVQFYPEGALWPYYNKIRDFKPGGFRFAVDNKVPVLPFCIYFRERTGLWKLIGKRPLVTAELLPPIYPNLDINKKVAIAEMMQDCHNKIEVVLEKHYVASHEYAQIDEKLLAIMGVPSTTKPAEATVTANESVVVDTASTVAGESVTTDSSQE